MKSVVFLIIVLLSSLRLIPHCFAWALSNRRKMISADVARWSDELFCQPTLDKLTRNIPMLTLLTQYPEFRTLFYHRIGWPAYLFQFLCRPQPTLHLACRDIGEGLFLQHAFSTIIAAKRVGKNCWVNQQVTIGFEDKDGPVLGDNVRICAGAKVIGAVNVGDNSVVGANAVVVKDVPPNCVVVGVPARIIRRDGVCVKS